MNKTNIEWVKNPDGTLGYTWNPITGCLNGCSYCYARKLANGRLKQRYLANPNYAVGQYRYPTVQEGDPFYPRFWEDRFDTIGDTIAKPRGIFVCDMSDLFGIGIPEEWTKRVLEHCRWCSQHRYYLLTKQPQNLAQFSPFPDNCWVGVTATDEMMARRAIQQLRYVQANVRFISLEPLLGEIRNVQWDVPNWVIIGAQTKPYKPPKLAWVEEIIFACVKAKIPYFLKDNLAPIIPGHISGDKLHQEMPEGR